MRTIKYNWKSEPQGNKEIGLVAQQIKELIPEVVETARDSMGTLMMNYSALIPVLVNAIREQQTQIESLKKRKLVYRIQFSQTKLVWMLWKHVCRN
ncbi:MAG: tail fiber domain-containing protein [Bacteroidota bacterium]|nr:MAG: tail fiber domain-containing protein [Bacteroidota bacterium]